MPAKRGDRVAPPARPGGWEARFVSSEVAKRLGRPVPNRPLQHLGGLGRTDRTAARDIDGRQLDQWQYAVTAGGRIWFCPDESRHIVWITVASTAHPKETER